MREEISDFRTLSFKQPKEERDEKYCKGFVTS